MKLRYWLLGVLIASFGCSTPGRPVELKRTESAEGVTVELVATFEGIRLYRIKGVGDTVYVADARKSEVALFTNNERLVGKVIIRTPTATVLR